MAATKRVVWSDGQLVESNDLTEIGANVDLFLQTLLGQMFGDTEKDGIYGFAPDTVPGATDAGSATVPTLGFLGPALRVTRIDATHIRVNPGFGLVYRATGVPAGEDYHRVVWMSPTAPEFLTGITITGLPSSGQYKRAIVTTAWRDLDISSSVQVMDASGNVSSSSEVVRTRPEVGTVDTVSSGIFVAYGTAAGSASGAARPVVPSSHVVLAELLLDSTGLANAANVDGVTSGITDLRPRLRVSKAAGGYSSRRATCSMDETTAARSARRMGAKRVGADEVDGWVQIPTGAAAVVTLDTSLDWRDAMVDITITALASVDNVPGGVSDSAFRRSQRNTTSAVESTGNPGIDRAIFYSEAGSADGSTGPTSEAMRTGADDASTSLIFFADSTTGALKCRGLAGGLNRELYFVATCRGPLGKAPASGVEA